MRSDLFLTVFLGVLSAYEHSDNPCEQAVIEIANRYSKRNVHIFTLAPDILSSNLVASLNVPVVLNTTTACQQWRTDTYLVLSRNVDQVVNFLRNNPHSMRTDTPWILGFYGEINTNELTRAFEQYFNLGILNVVAVNIERSHAIVHTYYPFRTRNAICYNYNPVVIDVWNLHKFLHRVEMFPKDKVDNLQSCRVKSLIFGLLPYIQFSPNNSVYPLTGKALPIFRSFSRNMNFTPVFSLVTNYSGGITEITTSPITLGFGVGGYDVKVAHGTTFGYRCYSWCMPTSVRSILGWESFRNTFVWTVWLAFIGSAIVAVVVTWLLLRFSDESQVRKHPSWMIVWNIIFEVPVPSPRDMKLRLFFSCFVVACLVIGTAFKARLHVLMSSPPSAGRMSTLSQVYSSEYDLFHSLEFNWLLQSLQNESFYKKRVHAYDRTQIYMKDFRAPEIKKDVSAVFMSDDYCNVMAAYAEKNDKGYYKVYSLPDCVASLGGVGFAFSRASPFSERLTSITTTMWESGMVIKYLSTRLPREVVSSEKVAISMEDIRPVFMVMCGGLVISAFVFVAEIIIRVTK